MTKTERIAELEGRVATLEATIERLDADRKTFVRHQQTLARHMRRMIAEKGTMLKAMALPRDPGKVRYCRCGTNFRVPLHMHAPHCADRIARATA